MLEESSVAPERVTPKVTAEVDCSSTVKTKSKRFSSFYLHMSQKSSTFAADFEKRIINGIQNATYYMLDGTEIPQFTRCYDS